MRKPERAVVHGHHPTGAQIEKSFGRVLGLVCTLRKPSGEYARWGAGRRRATALANLAEAGEVGGVAGVVEGFFPERST